MSWLSPISAIIDSESLSLRDLAISVGADPAHFYMYQDLSACDLRGQDLRGMNLIGTGLRSSHMDEKTLIDPEFDPRFTFKNEYVSIKFPIELLALVYGYADEANYVYRAWAFKSLIESALFVTPTTESLESFIRNSREFARLIDSNSRPTKTVRIQIYRFIQERAHLWAAERGRPFDATIYLELVLLSLLRRKFGGGDYKRFEDIVPVSLYVTSREHLGKLVTR